MSKKLRSLAAVLSLLTGLLIAGPATQAWASTDTNPTCPPDPWWQYSSVVASKYSLVPPAYVDSGMTGTIVLTAGATATATASVTGTASLSAIFANASVAIGVSFSLSLSASVAYSGSYTVPLQYSYAYLYAGALAKNFNWAKYQYVQCVGKRVAYGSAKGPYSLPAFWHVNH
jgi:hypothetical protein